jgi:hypothetical protein
MALMSPAIAGPLSEISQSVHVQDQMPGAYVTVYSRTIAKVVAQGTASSADERLPLLPGIQLRRDNLLFAVQEAGGVRSAEPTGDMGQGVAPGPKTTDDLGHVNVMTRLYECGEYVWVEGALPGATVSLTSTPTLLGSGTADEGVAVFRLTTPMPAPKSVRCFQIVTGVGAGPDTVLDSVALPTPAGQPLRALQVQLPVRACDTSIEVTRVIDGATVTCDRRSGVVEASGFFTDSDMLNLSRPLEEGDEITLHQSVAARCDRLPGSSGTITVEPMEPLEAPRVQSPLCVGATTVKVTGLRRGALVHLSANGETYDGTAPSGQDWLDCRIPALTGGSVHATQEMCGVVSPPAIAVEVDPHVEPPAPTVVGPLYQCAQSVSVSNVHAGATVQVFAMGRNGVGPISEQVIVLHTNAVIPVQPLLRNGDDVYVVQWACSDTGRGSPAEPVQPAPEVGAVDVVGMLFEGSTSVDVRGALPGGEVHVYAIGPDEAVAALVGRAWADPLHPVLVVQSTRPLREGDTVSARQVFCGHPSEGGLQVRVDHMPVIGPRPFYVVGHNPNSAVAASEALSAGANALEPDVQVVAIHPDQLCISHDPGGLPFPVVPLVEYLNHLHDLAQQHPQFALVVFDCKMEAAVHPEHGFTLLMAIRKHLTYDNELNVILSIASRDGGQGAFFDRIVDLLGPREGLMIDDENDAGAVSNYFTSRGVEHQGYGNGTSVLSALRMRRWRYSLEAACGIRAMAGRPKFVYAWTVNALLGGADQREYIRIGVDGMITDNVATLRAQTQKSEFTSMIRLATRLDNPMQPDNFNYGLLIHTSDQDHAGTDANLTFTITGSAGSVSKTINADLIKRMESDCWNYVTIPSPDLGSLVSLTVRRDDSGNAPDWHLDGVTVTSARYGVSAKASFNRWIDSTDPFTAALV